ncbi:MAG: hypothetical protein MZU79_02660 [Anaerotruncus sp.]|nr:hypothetical protein [Anaerotruncus sp.]
MFPIRIAVSRPHRLRRPFEFGDRRPDRRKPDDLIRRPRSRQPRVCAAFGALEQEILEARGGDFD